MRIEVKTFNKVRLMLDVNDVVKQGWVVNGNRRYCLVYLKNGNTVELDNPIDGISLEPDSTVSKRYISRLEKTLAKDL